MRTGLTGSALVRLLIRVTEAEAPESRATFADRLSQWLGWADAIALSNALSGALSGALPPAPSRAAPAARLPATAADTTSPEGPEQRDCARVRAALAAAIATEAAPDGATDFATCRWRYLTRQQAMEAAIAPLRTRVRAALAGVSPAMARLAAIDAVMEQALGAHERRLLATVPTLLERHFARLSEAARQAPPAADGGAAPPADWLDAFSHDMRAVLLAELEIRLQPVEGLLDALRAH